MPVPPSANGSAATSGSLFDLDLPVVREGEAPWPAPAPSYETMLAHARFLLDSGLALERRPNPEPFVLD
ncbi:MAG: hypothetical protein PHC88_11175 [Terrimicrobiaceae bacterium]|nr:hypothetical protein [Terrimicrobiaceae bacterium]